MNLTEMMTEFNSQYQVPHKSLTKEELRNAISLIDSELEELTEELYLTDETASPRELLNKSGSVTPAWKPKEDDELDKLNIAKELTDIIFITAQQMHTLGFHIDNCLEEVYNSNMSKLVPNDLVQVEHKLATQRYPKAYPMKASSTHKVLRCGETDKVIKPTCYKAADMSKVVK